MLPGRDRILIRNARLLDPDAGESGLRPADVLVAGGTILEVGDIDAAVDATCDRVIDGDGKILAPGIVNAHTHSPSSVMSGVGDDQSHPVFMWMTQAYTSNRTPEEVYLCAMLNCIQMLLSGTTAAIDHFPGQCFGPDELDAVLRASQDSGMRIALGMRFFDAEFGDIFPPNTKIPDDLRADIERVGPLKPQPLEGLREFFDDGITRWHGTDDGRLSVFPAPSNPERCTDAALMICAELAEKHDVGIHTHLLESRIQTELAQDQYGTTMVEHLRDLGIFSRRWSCAHSNWVTDAEIDIMADVGAVAIHNPESNLKLASGIAPVPKMIERGVTVALGTDGSSANDNLLMHEAMRFAAMLHRPFIEKRADWISSRQIWRMATRHGARAMLRDDVGDIAVGQRADLVLYSLKAPWWRPVNDAVSQMVFAETGSSVDTVMVDGRILVEDGRITVFDAEALMDEIEPMMANVRERNSDIFDVSRRMSALFA